MLAKSYRMKKNSQFDYIFKNGKVIKSSKLLVFYSKSKSIKPKIGVVVSKKIGNSVTRNRVKRIIREVARLNLSHLNQEYNYILVARPGIETLTFNEVCNTFLSLTTKNNLYV